MQIKWSTPWIRYAQRTKTYILLLYHHHISFVNALQFAFFMHEKLEVRG